MRKVLLTFFALLMLSPMIAVAQRGGLTARRAFLESPDNIFPLLSSEMKQSLVTSYDTKMAGSPVVEPTFNLFGVKCEVEELNDTFLRMTLDEGTSVELKLLKKKRRGHLIGLIYTTLEAPQLSVVVFYDASWQRLDASELLELPAAEDFFTVSNSTEHREVKKALGERGALEYAARFSPVAEILSLRVTTFDEKLARHLHSEALRLLRTGGINYLWNGRRFKRLND